MPVPSHLGDLISIFPVLHHRSSDIVIYRRSTSFMVLYVFSPPSPLQVGGFIFVIFVHSQIPNSILLPAARSAKSQTRFPFFHLGWSTSKIPQWFYRIYVRRPLRPSTRSQGDLLIHILTVIVAKLWAFMDGVYM